MKNAIIILTWVHLTDLLHEGLVKASDDGPTHWDQEVLVQTLDEGVYPPDTSTLRMRTSMNHHIPKLYTTIKP